MCTVYIHVSECTGNVSSRPLADSRWQLCPAIACSIERCRDACLLRLLRYGLSSSPRQKRRNLLAAYNPSRWCLGHLTRLGLFRRWPRELVFILIQRSNRRNAAPLTVMTCFPLWAFRGFPFILQQAFAGRCSHIGFGFEAIRLVLLRRELSLPRRLLYYFLREPHQVTLELPNRAKTSGRHEQISGR